MVNVRISHNLQFCNERYVEEKEMVSFIEMLKLEAIISYWKKG